MDETTRRMELALPLFSGLDLGLLMEARAQLGRGEWAGITRFMEGLGAAGQARTVRKLAAIWTATEIELKQAEASPQVMAELEERAAAQPFAKSFQDTLDFHFALLGSFGVTLGSSEDEPARDPDAPAEKPADSPSAG